MEIFFSNQLDFLNFFTGLLLLFVGVASVSKDTQDKSRPNWNWFALFSFLYGFNKWIDVLVMNLPSNQFFVYFNPFLTSSVYFLLYCFAISGYDFKSKFTKYSLLIISLIMSAIAGMQETSWLNSAIFTDLKYICGGFGGLWAFVVLLKYAHSGQYRSRFLYLAALGISLFSSIYAFYDIVDAWCYKFLGIPAALIQIVCIMMVIAGVWIGRSKYDENQAQANKGKILNFFLNQMIILVLAVMILITWFYVNLEGNRQGAKMQASLQKSADQVSSVFTYARISNILVESSATSTKNLDSLDDYLDNTIKSLNDVDRLRVLKLSNEGGARVISETNFKGQRKKSLRSLKINIDNESLAKVLSGQRVFLGRTSDGEGEWYSVLVPWRDAESGAIVAMVQTDMIATKYDEQLFSARLFGIIPMALFFISMILIMAYMRRAKAAKALSGYSHDKTSFQWLIPALALFSILSSAVLVLFFEIRRNNYMALADRFEAYATGGFERLYGFFGDTTGEDTNFISSFVDSDLKSSFFNNKTLKNTKKLFLGESEVVYWADAKNLEFSDDGNDVSGSLIISGSSNDNDPVIGQDVLKQPNYSSAIFKAITTKFPAAVIFGNSKIVVLVPNFINNETKPRDFLIIHYNLADLSYGAIVNSGQDKLVFELLHLGVRVNDEQVLYRNNIVNRYSGSYGGAQDLYFTAPMNFGDLILTAKIYPTDEFIKNNSSNSHWWALFFGLTASLLFSLYLIVILIDRQKAKHLVEERNLDVLRQKNRLQKYIDIAEVAVVLYDFKDVTLLNNYARSIFKRIIKSGSSVTAEWANKYLAMPENKILRQELLKLKTGKKKATENIRMSFTTLDGKPYETMWRFAVLDKEMDNTLIGVGVDISELTEAKVTIDQLREFDKLKDDLLKITSHEFKTPLVSIIGLSEVLHKQSANFPQDTNRYIDVIYRESLRLNGLVQKMVEAARHEKSQVNVNKTEFDLVAILSGFEYSVQNLLARNGSKLKFVTDLKSLTVNSDAAKISEIIGNLIDNAVKYGKQEQLIELRLSLEGKNKFKIEVIDQGKGVKKEDIEYLFKKFSRIDSSLTREQEGIGLGLYLCKQNIELLGGEINVKNVPEGGADFYIILPIK